MVHKWFTEFRCGRISTSDAEWPGRPKVVTTQEMIDEIHDIVLNDRRLKVREISETINISVGRVWYILHAFLGMRKLSVRWVPRLLTTDHKSGLVWLRPRNVWACFNVTINHVLEILIDDLLPAFSQFYNSAFVESLVLRSKKLNQLIFDSLIWIKCFSIQMVL